MEYLHTVIYKIKGVVYRSADVDEQTLFSDEKSRMKVILTNNLEKYTFENARALAFSLLLWTAIGSDEFEEDLYSEIEKIQSRRRKEHGEGPFVIFLFDGTTDDLSMEIEKELKEFIVCFDDAPKEKIRSTSIKPVSDTILAILFESNNITAVDQVSNHIVFYTENNKPVYNLTMETLPVSIYTPTPLTRESIDNISLWYDKLSSDNSFARVFSLLISSLNTKDDKLRSYLSAWTSLEIFINKVFSLYEERLFSDLNKGEHPKVRKAYFERIKDVMKDKYRLIDKFSLISSNLCPNDANRDTEKLKKAKKQRDALLHGENVLEDDLLVISVQELVRKYLHLHFVDSTNS